MRLFLILLSLLINFSLHAGIVGNTSMNIGTSARVAGMGYAFTGIADDGSAIEYNPAGLYKIHNYYFSMMHLNLGPEVAFEYVNAAYDLEFGTIGAGLSFIHLWDEADNTTSFDYFDFISSVAFSRELFNDFSAGTTVKFFNSTIGDYSASTVIFDLGLMWGFQFFNMTGLNQPNITLGACIKNIGPGLKYGTETESLPLMQRYGIGYKLIDTMTLTCDLVKEGRFPVKYGFGIENITGKFINLRLGYQGGETKKSFGGGVGILLKIQKFLATLDFTYLLENYSDNTMYFTISFQETPPAMERFGFRPEVIWRDRVSTITQEKVVEKEVEKVTTLTQEAVPEVIEHTTVITQESELVAPAEIITIITQEKEIETIKTNILEKISVLTQVIEGEPQSTIITQKQLTIITQKQIVQVGNKLDSIVVVVLNFENTGNSKNWEFLRKTIADSVSSTISDKEYVTVISRLIVDEVIEQNGISEQEVYKLENLKNIGAQLKANVIVKGSFIEINRALQITTEVFDLETGEVFASSKVLGSVGANMFDLMDRTAAAITKDLKKYKEK